MPSNVLETAVKSTGVARFKRELSSAKNSVDSFVRSVDNAEGEVEDFPQSATTKFRADGGQRVEDTAQSVKNEVRESSGRSTTQFESSGARSVTSSANSVARALRSVPDRITPSIDVSGSGEAIAESNAVEQSVNSVPDRKRSDVGVTGVASSIAKTTALNAKLAALPNRQVVNFSAPGSKAVNADLRTMRDTLISLTTRTTATTAAMLALGSALAPIAVTLGGIATAGASVAAVFGAITGTGLMQYVNQVKDSSSQLRQGWSEDIAKLEQVKQQTGELTAAQKERKATIDQIISASKQWKTTGDILSGTLAVIAERVEQQARAWGDSFVPLIGDAIVSIPVLTQKIFDILGPLTEFRTAMRTIGGALMEVIPQVVEFGVSLARDALPHMMRFGSYIRNTAGPAVNYLSGIFTRAYPIVIELTKGLLSLSKGLTDVGTVVLETVGPAIASFSKAAGVAMSRFASEARIELRSVEQAWRRHSDTIRSAAITAYNAVQSLIAGILHGIRTDYAGIVSASQRIAQAFDEYIVGGIRFAADELDLTTGGMVQSFSDFITNVESTIRRFVTLLTVTAVSAMQAFASVVEPIVVTLSTNWTDHGDTVEGIIRDIYGELAPMVSGFLASLASAVTTVLGTISDAWDRHGAEIKRIAVGAVKAILSAVRDTLATINGFWERHGDTITNVLDTAYGLIETLAIDRIEALLTVVQGTVERANQAWNRHGDTLQTVIGKVTSSLNSYQLAVLSLTPMLASWAARSRVLVPLMGSLAKILGGALLGAITTLFAPLTSLVTALGSSLVGSFGAAIASAGSFVTSITGVSTAIGLLTNPIALAVSAIIGLAAAWHTNFINIRDVTQSVLGVVKGLIRGDFDAVQQHINQAGQQIRSGWDRDMGGVVNSTRGHLDSLGSVFQSTLDWIYTNAVKPVVDSINQLFEEHRHLVTEDIDQLMTALTGLFDRLGGTIMPIINRFVDLATASWNMFGDEYLAVVKFTFDLIGSIINTALDAIATQIDVITDLMVGDWEGAWSAIEGYVTRVLNGIVNFVVKWGSGLVSEFERVFNAAKDLVSNVLTAISGFISDKLNAAAAAVSRILGGIRDTVVSIWNGIKTAIADALTSTNNTVTSRWDSIQNSVSQAVSAILSTVRDVWNTIRTTVTDLASQILGQLRQWGADIKNTVETAFGALLGIIRAALTPIYNTVIKPFIDRILRVWREMAPALKEAARGAWQGILETVRGTQDTLRSVIQGVIDWITSTWNSLKSTAESIWNGIASTIGGYVRELQRTLRSIWNGITQFVTSTIRGLVDTATSLWNDLASGIADIVRGIQQTLTSIWNGIVQTVTGIVSGFVNTVRSLWQDLVNAVVPPLRSLVSTVQQLWSSLVSRVQSIVQGFVNTVVSLWNDLKRQISSILSGIVQFVRSQWQGLVSTTKSVLNALLSAATAIFNNIRNTIAEVLSNILQIWKNQLNILKTVGQAIFDGLVGIVGAFTRTVLALFTSFFQALQLNWEQSLNTIKTLAESIFDGILSYAEKWAGRLSDAIGKLVDSIISLFEDLYNRLIGGSIVPDMLSAITDAFSQFISDLVSAIEQMVNDVVQWFTDLKTQALDQASQLKDQFLSTIDTLASEAFSRIETFVSDTISRLSRFKNDAVSRATELKNQVVTKLTELKDQGIEKVRTLAETVMDYLTGRKGPISGVGDAGKAIVSDFASGISDAAGQAADAVDGVVSSVRDKLPGSDAREGPLDDLSKTGPAIPRMLADGIHSDMRRVQNASSRLAAAASPDPTARMTASLGGNPATDEISVELPFGQTLTGDRPTPPSESGDGGGDTYIEFTVEPPEDASRQDGRRFGRGLSDELRSHNLNR